MEWVRKVIVNTILIPVFVSLALLVIRSLMAEAVYSSTSYNGYEKAIALDPLNSEYLAGFADFLKAQKIDPREKEKNFIKAEGLHEKALYLNPFNAEYALYLGQVETQLFLIDRNKYKEKLKSGLADFKRALQNDPNGFNVLYSTAYAGVTLWDFISQRDRESTLDRAKRAIKMQPYYGKHIYPLLWKKTRDFLTLQRIAGDDLGANITLYNFFDENGLIHAKNKQRRVVEFCRRSYDSVRAAREGE